MYKKQLIITALFAWTMIVSGCVMSTLQGMQGSTYISKVHPAIEVEVPSLPLRTAGQILPSITDDTSLWGVNTYAWIAVYGGESLSQPMAVVSQATLPKEYYWDATLVRPFSITEGTVIYNDLLFQTCTFIVGKQQNAFVDLIPGATEGEHYWLVRRLAARTNFNMGKVTLEYREILPEGITNTTALATLGRKFMQDFLKRAEDAFKITPLKDTQVVLKNVYPSGIATQYLNTNFFGTLSRYDVIR